MRIITNGFLKGEWGVVPHNNPYIRELHGDREPEREREVYLYIYIHTYR